MEICRCSSRLQEAEQWKLRNLNKIYVHMQLLHLRNVPNFTPASDWKSTALEVIDCMGVNIVIVVLSVFNISEETERLAVILNYNREKYFFLLTSDGISITVDSEIFART